MKTIKTKKYSQLKEVSFQTIFNDALQKSNGDEGEAAKVVLDAATSGTWAMWDQVKIDQAIQTILSQFSNPQVEKIEGTPLSDANTQIPGTGGPQDRAIPIQ